MDAVWRGRIVDERGEPLPDVVVALEDAAARPHVRLALTTARADGRFEVEPAADPSWDAPDGLAIVVYDALGLRALAHHAAPDADARHDLGDIVVRRRVLDGWLATDAEGEPVRVTHGNRVDVLVDDEMFDAFEDAIKSARREICLSQLLFDLDFSAAPPGAFPARLVDRLHAAAMRGVKVRILVNANAVIPDSHYGLQRHFARSGDRVIVRPFPMSPNVMHAKILVVDRELAFVIGPPFEPKYWDTARHPPHNPRRGRNAKPLHDMSSRLRGPVVAHVHNLFARLWNGALAPHEENADDRLDLLEGGAPAGEQTVQVARTLPPERLDDAPRGDGTILQAYLRAIAQARSYIYVETQYYTNPTVAEAITRALRRRPELQAILVINEDTDVPTYVRWQKRRLSEMGHPREPQLGVFVLRSPTPIYVHAKAALVDDVWATVGTANLDSMSLEVGEEFSAPLDPNIDVNLVLPDGIDGAPRTGIVPKLRRRLWGEHLGDRHVWGSDEPPPGGWLALWREVAEENVRLLEAGKPLRGRVVPYRPEDLAPVVED